MTTTADDNDSALAMLVLLIDPQARLQRAWQLKGGLSAQMTAFEIESPGGQTKKLILRRPGEAALKRNPGAAADEFKVLQFLRSVGAAVPTPYYFDQSGEIYAAPYLVIEYIDGTTDFAPMDVIQFARQAAFQLVRIHSVKSTTVDLSFLPAQTKRVTDKLAARPADRDLAPDEGRIRAALVSFSALRSRNEPVLVHGDFWPGNWLWKDGDLVAVIDWEDAEVGDPLADFAVSRLDMLLIFGEGAMNAFTEHYRSQSDIDFGKLPYWDLFAALRAAPNLAEWAAGYPALGRPDITERTMRDGHRLFVSQAVERLSDSARGLTSP